MIYLPAAVVSQVPLTVTTVLLQPGRSCIGAIGVEQQKSALDHSLTTWTTVQGSLLPDIGQPSEAGIQDWTGVPCERSDVSDGHLFHGCSYAKQVWHFILRWAI
ncbi:hypothetical protein Ancab_016396 [Ancistrocladus abbreviatus]